MKQQNAYPLRLEETLQKKLKQLAKDNDRSYRAQIENILKKYISEYEKVNGVIKFES
ncbi:MAG: hypothetical protein ACI4NN_02090 [Pyramidobacter sp.]